MNHIYRVVWNAAAGVWQAVAETATSRGKSSPSQRLRKLALASGSLLALNGAYAADLPTGGTITAGSGALQQHGNNLTIDQASGKLAIDWDTFSIGANNRVVFNQPSASAVAMNRVLGSDVSVIQGALQANGQVFLINPNGVLFTPTAQVNVGGLVASTLSMSREDFLAGNYTLSGAGSGAVINQGNIVAAAGGTVALIAAKIDNSGSISAEGGNVLLGAGSRVTLDLGGAVKLDVEQGAIDALIANGGAIRADGGTVLLTARAAQDLAATVINHTGLIEAKSLATGADGSVTLLGEQGTVLVAGDIDVSAASGSGGTAIITGERVLIDDGAHIDARGANGGGAIYVGGGWQGQDPAIKQATATVIKAGATLDASATDNGDGGTIVAWSDITAADSITRAHGALKATGGANGGAGGNIETSGHALEVGAAPDVSASRGEAGTWLIDPYNVIVTAGSGQFAMTGNPFTSTADAAYIGIDIINTALQSGNVSILSGNGSSLFTGSIFWQTDYTYTGASARTLTLTAHDGVVIANQISSTNGALSLNFQAANYINIGKNLTTNGGSINLQSATTYLYPVGEDVYLNTGGGNLDVSGDLIVGTNGGGSGITAFLNTGNGNVDIKGKINSIASAWSSLAIDAGNGDVIFGKDVGTAVPLLNLSVTANNILISGNNMVTLQQQDYWGNVQFDGLAQFINPSFENGLTGWSVTNSRVYMNGGSTIGGFATPNDPTGPSPSAGDAVATDYTDFTSGISNDVAAGSGSNSLVMSSDASCNAGFCIVRGPYVVSDSTVTLPEGGSVSFKWKAAGGSDAYDVYGYLLNVDTGATHIILNGTGATASAVQPWTTATTSVTEAGTYRFVFVSGSWDATGGQALGAQLFIDDISAGNGLKNIQAAGVNFHGNIDAGDNRLVLTTDKIDFGGTVSGTGQLTIETRSAGQSVEVGGSANGNTGVLDITADKLARIQPGFSAITLGSSTGTGSTTVVADTGFDTNVTLRGGSGGIAVNAALAATAGHTITLDTSGTSTQTAAGTLSADGLALLGSGNHRLDGAVNSVAQLAANTGSLTFANSGALTVGSVGALNGITATGAIDVATTTGNLTVNRGVVTTDTSSAAIVLNAGKDTTAGTTTGGNILLSGNPAITTGSGGRATLYTGSVSGSSGVTAKVGSGSGRFRYNSDESASNFTSALGSGLYAIYREAPTATITANNYSKVYDGLAYNGASGFNSGGLLNGDTLTGSATYASGINAGTHSIGISGLSSSLGYTMNYVGGTLTVSQRQVNVAVANAHKIYGEIDPSQFYTAEAQSGNRGLIAGDSLGSVTRAAGENVGNYAFDTSALVNGNYLINITTGNTALSITPRAVDVAVANAHKIYGEIDPSLLFTAEAQSGNRGLIAGDSLGTLSRAAGENVGSYAIDSSGLINGNYLINLTTSDAALAITPRAIKVSADSTGKILGALEPALTYTAEAQTAGRGLLTGDTLNGTISRASGEIAGNYVIGRGTLTDALNANYAIDFIDGVFSINGVPPEVVSAQQNLQFFTRNETQIVNPTLPAPTLPSSGGNAAQQQVSGNLELVAVPASTTQSQGNSAQGDAGDTAYLQYAQVATNTGGPLKVFVVEGGIKLPAAESLNEEQ